VKFAIYSAEGAGLSWAKRLLDEGHEVLMYVDYIDPKLASPQRHVGDGIVPKAKNKIEWQLWGRGGIYLFDSSHWGEFAESLRKRGERVIGSGAFCDRLEEDREWGFDIARSVGMKLPKYENFATIPDAITKLAKLKGKHYLKTDQYIKANATTSGEPEKLIDHLSNYITPHVGTRISGILQEQLDGFALSTARWFNGNTFVGPYEGTVEHKKLLDKDRGPATGCSFNILWFYGDDAPPIARALNFEKLAEVWRKNNAPPGIYDINALLCDNDGEAYFLEWTPRMGYDAQPTDQKGIRDLGGFLTALVDGRGVDSFFDRGRMYGSVRVTATPYPAERIEIDHKDSAYGLPVRDIDGLWSKRFLAYGIAFDEQRGYWLADPQGLVGLVSGAGNDVDLFEGIYEYLDTHKIVHDQMYRSDAQERCTEDLKHIVSLGYTTR
jgi:hypothetical protein